MALTKIQTIELYIGIVIATFVLMWLLIGRVDQKRCSFQIILSNRLRTNITGSKIESIVYVIIPIFWYWLYSARDFSIGTDTYHYHYRYMGISQGAPIEFVFNLFNRLGSVLGLEFSQFLFICCLFTTMFVFQGLRYFLEENWVAVFVGSTIYYFEFFFLSMNAMRQIMAVAVLFYGMKYLVEKRYIKYLIFCIFASGIHFTAIVGICFIIFCLFNNHRNGQFGYYSLLCVSSIVFPIALVVVDNLYGIKYGVDFESIGFGFLIDYIVPMVCVFFYLLDKKQPCDGKMQFFINIFLLVIPFRLVGYLNTPLMRMAYYPSIVQIVLVPKIVQRIKKKSLRITIYSLILIIYIVQFLFLRLSVNGIYPYKFSE